MKDKPFKRFPRGQRCGLKYIKDVATQRSVWRKSLSEKRFQIEIIANIGHLAHVSIGTRSHWKTMTRERKFEKGKLYFSHAFGLGRLAMEVRAHMPGHSKLRKALT